ncbi:MULTISPECIES: aldehyde oxidoreductase molybdenum-binding subunit PaoC [Methylobacterium]|uniref:aldehyde oxidoreductase molybdenum-binding subunit PaoC n=1 Tax=Methylobacterium TaxID=407 RepID=UPI0003772BD6|nr:MULTISPECIES: aldehyde oxidoreductase molybdenum-binding subunit PaoC [Methylobacterium]MBN4094987.1 xanthine dehydrogenase family protein molybdopterin-binding subunit [Methylobacterium sp. OT2]UIN32633.1 xanthine dehydrogenase family protein molybdopterin-binding subunit [Methylobacterium oryzae]SFS89983.1 xanthine dehydrogenase YagR molybdenum-binding subunit [Methylobacterium sp. yr668]
MRFDTPAGQNSIDGQTIVGQPHRRVDGALKVTGTAPYAYERHDAATDPAYGWIVGATIARGRVTRIDAAAARRASGVLAILTTLEHDSAPPGFRTTLHLFGGAEVRHYHQAVALVVAETFEEARAAAHLVRVDYEAEPARCDLAAEAGKAEPIADRDNPDYPVVDRIGAFEEALAAAPVILDEIYTTPDQTHAMMEPHATTAAWRDGKLTIWTSAQVVSWHRNSLAQALGIAKEDLRLDAPFIGGGFGSKLIMRSDALLSALGARAVGRPCKVALQRPLIANNGTRRAGTIQRIRLGATHDGRLTAIGHHSLNGNLSGAYAEAAIAPTRLIYAAPNRELSMRLATLDLAEGNDMRAPGEAPGLMALEIAMDEMAEKLGIDPVAFRIRNDTQVDPRKPHRQFSERHLIECLQLGADRFGWARRNPVPGAVGDGCWLVGMGMAAGFRQNLLMPSGARVRLEQDGRLSVETDMTDIGTGSYTILAQTAAEMMGVPIEAVTVRLGDSDYPEAAGSGGQFGANNATSGLYAACVALRASVAARLGFNAEDVAFADGRVTAGSRSVPLRDAVETGPLTAEDRITYGDLDKEFVQATFGAQFAEVAVNRFTGEMRVRRMLAVIDAGRVLNPLTARSQVIGAMTMGVGSALMEALVVDTRHGFFINHDLGGYEVPVHADIPHLDVVFLDHPDPVSSPMKAKGIGEIGLCGAAAAVANAVYNATGIRVRDYPITLDKLLDRLPRAA